MNVVVTYSNLSEADICVRGPQGLADLELWVEVADRDVASNASAFFEELAAAIRAAAGLAK